MLKKALVVLAALMAAAALHALGVPVAFYVPALLSGSLFTMRGM